MYMETLTSTSTIRKSAGNWWVLLIIGILLIIAGFFILVYPISTYISLSVFFGVLVFITGLTQLFFALSNRKSMPRWGWALFLSIVNIIIGLILMVFPGISMAILPYFVGFWMLLRGVNLLSYTSSSSSEVQLDRGWLIFGGIVHIILAILILLFPIIGVFTIVAWTGWAFLAGGVFEMILAFRMKRMQAQLA
jgi:uncharacterized membrane protein HdeD (DUF308 family)